MKSCFTHHYPQVVFQEEEKFLWNPILKKPYKHLPEERVRLAFIEYLTLEAGFSKNRISFESPIHLPGDKGSSRTDILCYNEQFKPLLLVECKSRDVFLNEKTALQIARYNQQINAPFLLVTNGLQDYWYIRKGPHLKQLPEAPNDFYSKNENNRDYDYWSRRGFSGKVSSIDQENWIIRNCQELYTRKNSTVHYLKFKGSQLELELANYYRVFSAGEDFNLAVATSSTPEGTTKLTIVMNRNNFNVGIVSISLDSIINEEAENATLLNEKGITRFDAVEELGFSFDQDVENLLELTARFSS